MNLRLFHLEIALLFRDSGVRVGLVLFCGLFFFAVVHQRRVLAREQVQIQQSLETSAEKHQQAKERLLEVERGERQYDSMWDDPRGYYTWHQRLILYPNGPLGLLAVGQRDLHGPLTAVSIFQRAESAGRDIANPVPRLMGTFDPAFVLVYLLPLLIIGLCQGVLSREREAGTLPMMLAGRCGLGTLILMKIGPRFMLLAATAAACIPMALWVAGCQPLAQVNQLLQLTVFLGAYMLFWFLAALVLNLWIRNSAAHAVALIGLWCLVCLLLPAGISTLAKHIYPVPSQMALVNSMRTASREQERRRQEVLAQYYQDHPELSAPASEGAEQGFFDFYRKSLGVSRATEAVIQPQLDRYQGQWQNRLVFEQRLAYFSPPALLADFVEELAGSSGSQYQAFDMALGRFSLAWRDYFQNKAFAGQLIGSDDLASFPSFTHTPAPPSAGWRLAVLIGSNMLLGTLIFWRLRGRAAYDLL